MKTEFCSVLFMMQTANQSKRKQFEYSCMLVLFMMETGNQSKK